MIQILSTSEIFSLSAVFDLSFSSGNFQNLAPFNSLTVKKEKDQISQSMDFIAVSISSRLHSFNLLSFSFIAGIALELLLDLMETFGLYVT